MRGWPITLAIFLVLVVLLVGLRMQVYAAEPYTSDDTYAAIDLVADPGTSLHAWLTRVVDCETNHTFDPYTMGDGGTSYGVAQLHRGGLLTTFYAEFGSSADVYNPYLAIQFMAEQFSQGHASAWSCR